MNSLIVIYPYQLKDAWEDAWVFDDEQAGLAQEPFVSGADKIIGQWVKDMPTARFGFKLIFSARPFPGYQHQLDWRREEYDGNWYYSAALDMEGWLCPALFKYFETAPASIYAQCQALLKKAIE
ncbi:MAG: hypothetical protein F6J87_27825 [Spirulina sp. SIO3F2]|nr:hypothetical protein [Spirulina sp. SIO3F2]